MRWTCGRLAAVAAALLASRAAAQNDPEGSFGPIVRLPIAPAQGAVTGDGTTVYASSQAGEIYLADIKSGFGEYLNRGGDGQTLADLCMDSREGQTLYGAGRDSGLLFAFTKEGKLVRRYALTDASKHYISSCVQTRYYLYVTDAMDDTMYRFDLPDKGPDRGAPPPLADGQRDGTAIEIGGDWESAPKGKLGAMSVEWSQLWNETGWVLNSATGKLYNFPLKAKGDKAKMSRVWVDGAQKTFPGATKMLIDSTNERVFYLAQPGRNAVAVVEINEKDPMDAMYIRTITSPLINGPIGLAEFGEWLYVLNANLEEEDRDDAKSTLVQLPKHQQVLEEDYDKDEPFTETEDDEDPPQKELFDMDELYDAFTEPARKTKKSPVKPLDEVRAPDTVDARIKPKVKGKDGKGKKDSAASDDEEGNTFDTSFKDDADDGSSCFPGDAQLILKGGKTRRMDELNVGDHVLVSPDVYSPVFLFTHQDARAEPVFARIHHDGADSPLTLTPGHYLYANDELVAASAVRAGDRLRTSSGLVVRVTRIARAHGSGLYNPQTLHGDVVVNGVVASTYTRAVDPRTAAALLAPVRAIAVLLGARWDALVARLGLFASGSPLLAAVAPTGPARLGW